MSEKDAAPKGRTNAIGLDVGTYTLQAARRAESGDKITFREEINGFLHVPKEEKTEMIVQMVRDAGAPMIEHGSDFFVFGESGLEIAYAWDRDFRRPMRDGIISPDEKDAFHILDIILRSIIDPLPGDNTVLMYSSPAIPKNVTNKDPEYHQRLLQSIFDGAEFANGQKIKAFPMCESQAIVIDQLGGEYRNTGIGVSFGAGMVNISYCVLGIPIFEFSLVGSGDWIDQASATAVGENSVYINRAKRNIDLTKPHRDSVEQSIITHYNILLDRVAKGIAAAIVASGRRTGRPCPVVVAGGTATPNGFVEMFTDRLRSQDWGKNFELGKVWLAPGHERCVARGLLKQAERQQV